MGKEDIKREEKMLKKEIEEEIKKREGWISTGLRCPKCKSMDTCHKTVNIIGYLYIDRTNIPDTLIKCVNCGYTGAYKGMRMIMQLK